MARLSTIDQLPPEVREEIGRLRQAGRTIDQILGKLRELDIDPPSRSALGRHVKQLDQIGEELRRSRTVAEALVERFGDAPESKSARVNIELMQALVMKCLVDEDGGVVALDAKEAMFMASALQKLAGAAKADVDREVKIRKELGARVAKAVDAIAGEAERDAKLSKADVLKRIREEVYGIVS